MKTTVTRHVAPSQNKLQTETTLAPKTDCFAYSEAKRTCTALKRLYCKSERCGFYKPHTQQVSKK